MSIVTGASVALTWVFAERGTEAAIALRAEELSPLWLGEAATALWLHAMLGETSSAQPLVRIEGLANAAVALMSIEPYVRRALQLATQFDHFVYDCLYLALVGHQPPTNIRSSEASPQTDEACRSAHKI